MTTITLESIKAEQTRLAWMIAELEAIPPHDGLQATIAAMLDSLQTDLTDAKWDTLQRRFQGHKRVLLG